MPPISRRRALRPGCIGLPKRHVRPGTGAQVCRLPEPKPPFHSGRRMNVQLLLPGLSQVMGDVHAHTARDS